MWDPKLRYFQKEKLVNFLVGWVYFHLSLVEYSRIKQIFQWRFCDFIHHGLIGFRPDIIVWKSRAGHLD
jgi:hypothetical protein